MIKKVTLTILTWIIAIAIIIIYPIALDVAPKTDRPESMALFAGAASISRLIYIRLCANHKDDDIRLWKVISLGSVVVLIPTLITRFLNLGEYTQPVSLFFYLVAIFAGAKYSKFLEKKDRPVSEKPKVKLKL